MRLTLLIRLTVLFLASSLVLDAGTAQAVSDLASLRVPAAERLSPFPLLNTQALNVRAVSWLSAKAPCLGGLFRQYSRHDPLVGTSSKPLVVLKISGSSLTSIGGMENRQKATHRRLLALDQELVIHYLFTSKVKVPAHDAINPRLIWHNILHRPQQFSPLGIIKTSWALYLAGRKIVQDELRRGCTVVIDLCSPYNPVEILAAWLLTFRFNLPRVLTSYHAGPLYSGLPLIKRTFRIMVPLFALGSYIFGISKASTDYFFGRPHVVASGTDIDFFSRSLGSRDAFLDKYGIKEGKTEGVDPEAFLLFDPSRISADKGHEDFNGLAERLKVLRENEHIRAQIVIMGPSEDKGFTEKLRREISLKGLSPYICILPSGNREDVRNGYAAASLVVRPSRTEALSQTLLEAAAMELPVVSYRIEGIPEAVEHSVTGLLAEPGDVYALNEFAVQLLRNPDLRRRMGQATRKRVEEKFSLDALARTWIHFYYWMTQTASASSPNSSPGASTIRMVVKRFWPMAGATLRTVVTLVSAFVIGAVTDFAVKAFYSGQIIHFGLGSLIDLSFMSWWCIMQFALFVRTANNTSPPIVGKRIIAAVLLAVAVMAPIPLLHESAHGFVLHLFGVQSMIDMSFWHTGVSIGREFLSHHQKIYVDIAGSLTDTAYAVILAFVGTRLAKRGDFSIRAAGRDLLFSGQVVGLLPFVYFLNTIRYRTLDPWEAIISDWARLHENVPCLLMFWVAGIVTLLLPIILWHASVRATQAEYQRLAEGSA